MEAEIPQANAKMRQASLRVTGSCSRDHRHWIVVSSASGLNDGQVHCLQIPAEISKIVNRVGVLGVRSWVLARQELAQVAVDSHPSGGITL